MDKRAAPLWVVGIAVFIGVIIAVIAISHDAQPNQSTRARKAEPPTTVVVHQVKIDPPLPLLPKGVYQVGDRMFLIRPGFETNMHHLCDAKNDQGDHIGVDSIDVVNGDFVLTCSNSVGKKYRELPLIR